jgi:hypothetical protein
MMTAFYAVEPEVAGGWGEHTIFARMPREPMVIHRLHYEFEGWDGDELLEGTPCFIVSERLAREIEGARLTGVKFDAVEVTTSNVFRELYPNRQVPTFVWLKVEGQAGRDDFGMSPDLVLVVSKRTLELLQRIGFSNAAPITPFERQQQDATASRGS